MGIAAPRMGGNIEKVETGPRRPPRPSRPKKAEDELKAYRDRLTHGTANKPEFDYELLTMLLLRPLQRPQPRPQARRFFRSGWWKAIPTGAYSSLLLPTGRFGSRSQQ